MIQVYVLYCTSCKWEIVEAGYSKSLTCDAGRAAMFRHIIHYHIMPYLDENTDLRFDDFKVYWNYWCNFVQGRPKK